MSCQICLDNLFKEEVSALDCGHVFHAKCIQTWRSKSPLCPFCKKTTNQVVKSLYFGLDYKEMVAKLENPKQKAKLIIQQLLAENELFREAHPDFKSVHEICSKNLELEREEERKLARERETEIKKIKRSLELEREKVAEERRRLEQQRRILEPRMKIKLKSLEDEVETLKREMQEGEKEVENLRLVVHKLTCPVAHQHDLVKSNLSPIEDVTFSHALKCGPQQPQPVLLSKVGQSVDACQSEPGVIETTGDDDVFYEDWGESPASFARAFARDIRDAAPCVSKGVSPDVLAVGTAGAYEASGQAPETKNENRRKKKNKPKVLFSSSHNRYSLK